MSGAAFQPMTRKQMAERMARDYLAIYRRLAGA